MSAETITPRLLLEGGIKVLYKGSWVKEIPLENNETFLGVMDPENDIYPDINLRQYRVEGEDPYISRRHARFLRDGNNFFIEDMCGNNSTSIDTKINVINKEKRELKEGNRIYISESIAFLFITKPKSEDEKKADEVREEEKIGSVSGRFYLEMEQGKQIFFKPKNGFTGTFDLNPEVWSKDPNDQFLSLQIGRRSTEDNIYPDVDLWKYHFKGDEYIARRHARLYENNKVIYFQDISGKGSTWVNEKDDEHRLVKTTNDSAIKEIKEGDKLMISDSVVFLVKKYV